MNLPQPPAPFTCSNCGRTWVRRNDMLEGVGCAVLHRPNQCCHYGYDEVKPPAPQAADSGETLFTEDDYWNIILNHYTKDGRLPYGDAERLKVLQQHVASKVAAALQAAQVDEKKFLERLKLEFDANKAQYAGEPWADSDAAIMVNKRLALLDGERRKEGGD